MIRVRRTLVADNADVLAGTQLDQTVDAGAYEIVAASTAADTLLTISLAGITIVDEMTLPLRANGIPAYSDDPSQLIFSPAGTRPVINVNIQAAATVVVDVVFTEA